MLTREEMWKLMITLKDLHISGSRDYYRYGAVYICHLFCNLGCKVLYEIQNTVKYSRFTSEINTHFSLNGYSSLTCNKLIIMTLAALK